MKSYGYLIETLTYCAGLWKRGFSENCCQALFVYFLGCFHYTQRLLIASYKPYFVMNYPAIALNTWKLFLPIPLILSLAACQQEAIKTYNQPVLDPGRHQSPINIFTKATHREFEDQHFTIHFQDKVNAVENLGHTIQLDFAQGSTITASGITYDFKQMHFHTPSEHLIDGITYPMELHIVSEEENSAAPHYLVIAVLFKMGEENRFINEFLNTVPKHEHSKASVETDRIKLRDLFTAMPMENLGHHYHYQGSLTTPPYSENVSWFVLKKIFEASPEQIQTINNIEGNNARHLEPKNDRVIEDN